MSSQLLITYLSTLICLTVAVQIQERCGVFEPFRVSPDGAKYTIGGPFALHLDDCLTARPAAVQQLVAVQWVLSYWNQNLENERAKIALFAGDSCSRETEVISQTFQFLHQSGHFAPLSCTSGTTKTAAAGIFGPPDVGSVTERLVDVLKAANLPVVALSTQVGELLKQKGVGDNLVTVAPPLMQYAEAVGELVTSLGSNLVSLLIEAAQEPIATAFAAQLKKLGVRVKAVVLATDREMAQKLADSRLIVSLLSRENIEKAFLYQGVGSLSDAKRIWIFTPLSGSLESEDFSDATHDLLAAYTPGSVAIVVRQKRLNLPAFQSYFVDILKNNFQAYTLLASYMKQMHNCTIQSDDHTKPRCQDVTSEDLAKKFHLLTGVEEVVKATMVLAKYIRLLSSGVGARLTVAQLLRSVQQHIESAPLDDLEIQLDDSGNLLGTEIEGFQLVTTSASSATGVELRKILQHKLGSLPVIITGDISWPNGDKILSVCPNWSHECSDCQHVRLAEPTMTHLLKKGDLYMVGLSNFHKSDSHIGHCRTVRTTIDSIAFPLALFFALETAAQHGRLRGLQIGAVLSDICGENGLEAVKQLNKWEDFCTQISHKSGYIDSKVDNITVMPSQVLSFVSGLSVEATGSIASLFGQSGTSKHLLTGISRHNPLLTTPKPILTLLKRLKLEFISVYVSQDDSNWQRSFETFRELAPLHQICIAEEIPIIAGVPLKRAPMTQVALMFTNSHDSQIVLNAHKAGWTHERLMYIFVDKSELNWNWSELEDMLLGSIVVERGRTPIRPDFQEFLNSVTPELLPQRWMVEFWQSHFNCSPLGQQSSDGQLPLCSGKERLSTIDNSDELAEATRLLESVEQFLLDLDRVYKHACPQQNGLCDELKLENIQTVSGVRPSPTWFFTSLQQRISISHYLEIGNWSESGGLMLEPSKYQWYDGSKWTSSPPESLCQPATCQCDITREFWTSPLGTEEWISTPSVNGTRMFILLGLASFLSFSGVLVLLLIVYKVAVGVVRGNQSLGLMLLCSCLLLYATAFFFLFEPSKAICQARWFLHSFSYSLIFGVMIAKAVQLRNAETLGSGGHVSYWTYWLLFFFIAAVQGSLNLQWVMSRNPLLSGLDGSNGTSASHRILRCNWTRTEFLLSHVYDVLLLVLVCLLAGMNRNVKRLASRNWGETKWLLTTGLMCVGLWTAWMSAVALVPSELVDTAVVLSSLSSATLILALMFGPKLVILVSYRPTAFQPQSDQLSSAASTKSSQVHSATSTMRSCSNRSVTPVANCQPTATQQQLWVDRDDLADGAAVEDTFNRLTHSNAKNN